MSLYRHPKSAYWWVRFTLRGREIRQSTGTKDRGQAEEYEQGLRARYWRAVRLGESLHTWEEARKRWTQERSTKRSLSRDAGIFREYRVLDPIPLREISTEKLAELRTVRAQAVSAATVNREFALLRAVLTRAVRHWRWLEYVPAVPMVKLELPDPRWVTRAQFEHLVSKLPAHSADMARLAVATGLRRSNITGLTWDRIDLDAGFAYIPSSQSKGKRGIPVPLNAEAIAVLRRWNGRHPTHVFCWRHRPITSLVTRRWRAACQGAGLHGLRFHDLRHTWASWQAQAGTPAYAIRELGGWASDAMVKRYAHLGAEDLKVFADRTLVRMKVGTPRKRAVARHR